MTSDTIYALSSGSPPAAVAVVRISGPEAGRALAALAGAPPPSRRAALRTVRAQDGETLDRALVLFFPGPGSATGEDLAELHLHGGRAVVASVLAALAAIDGLRAAAPGEFTRRAFDNGRIDLAEAEGLADLLEAETQAQRRSALALAGGALSRRIHGWQTALLGLSARVEAVLDFSDEGEVGDSLPAGWDSDRRALAQEMSIVLGRPGAERLRDGVRVVIAGPPNSGKSSLLNSLVGREAAITSALPGTTRDLVEAPIAIGGMPFLLVDTAGLRDTDDEIESIGVGRARDSLAAADLILWLGAPGGCPGPAVAGEPSRNILVRSRIDIVPADPSADLNVSAVTGEGLDALAALLVVRAGRLLPAEGEVALNARHRAAIAAARDRLEDAGETTDILLVAETLRSARAALDQVTGRAGVEEMLDSLFGRFCVGK